MLIPLMLRVGSAFSGLLLLIFVLAHLIGVLPALFAPNTFETYATALHQSPWLHLLEPLLLVIAILHVGLTTSKTLVNRQGENTGALKSRRGQPLAALASQSKVLTGVITLCFALVHLQQLRWTRPADGAESAALIAVLQQPLNLVLYIGGSIAIGLHLLHGTEAAHRSLGWLNPANKSVLRQGGRLLAAFISAGFLLSSLGLAMGVAA